jgi:signal peptide peptidase SppA
MRDVSQFNQLLAGRALAIDRGALGRYAATWSADVPAVPPMAAAGAASRTTPNVALIGILGFIEPHESVLSRVFGGTPLDAVRQRVREAAANPKVDAIALIVNSPGGFVEGVPETADVIRQAALQKPVVAIVDGISASAAYWLTAQASYVTLTPSGEVGSIGVFMAHSSYAGANTQQGIERTYISAPTGGFKTEGNADEPLSGEGRAYLQSQVDAMYRDFVAAVARGRSIPTARVEATYGQGRVVLARDALSRRMVDAIVPTDTAFFRVLSGDVMGLESEQLHADHDRMVLSVEHDQMRAAMGRSASDEVLLASAYITARLASA